MEPTSTSALAGSSWSWSTRVSSRLADRSFGLVLDDVGISRLSLVDDEWLGVISDHLLGVVLIYNCLIMG